MATYKAGDAVKVFIEGNTEPVWMRPIDKDGFCAGGGVLLLMDRCDGEIDKIVNLLNRAELNEE